MMREIDKRTIDAAIAALVEPGSTVFDIGCGDGTLLGLLAATKGVRALGLDIKAEAVLRCLAKGIPAIHGDLDGALASCRDGMYDYVVLSQTLQVLKHPHVVLEEIVRIGKKAIVSFPNFGHASVRWSFVWRGRMPKSKVLPYEWYDSPNIHHLTLRDFEVFCVERGIEIVVRGFFGRRLAYRSRMAFPNLFAKEALFVIRKKPGSQEREEAIGKPGKERGKRD
jgi:methionine biosynthesis protein MetW